MYPQALLMFAPAGQCAWLFFKAIKNVIDTFFILTFFVLVFSLVPYYNVHDI